MQSYLFFKLPFDKNKGQRELVIYCCAGMAEKNNFEQKYRSYIGKNGLSDIIYLMGPQKDKDGISAVEKVLQDRDEFGPYEVEVNTIYYFIDNDLLCFKQLPENIKTQLTGVLKKIKDEGMWYILTKNNALLKATANHHYILPSKKHSNQYIRVANAMVLEPEIEFIALFCIENITQLSQLKHIYCDTGGILPVAASIKFLLNYLQSEDINITSESFRSYDAVRPNTDYHFTQANSLVLISSSASGGLAGALKLKYPELETSFMQYLYAFDTINSATILCNIKKHTKDHIAILDETKCNLCRSGSATLRIQGDHLSPETSDPTQAIGIKGAHAPSWVNDFMMLIMKQKIVAVNVQRTETHSSQDSKHQIYVDLNKLIELRLGTPELADNLTHFFERLDQLLNNAVPRNLKRIIYLKNEGSKSLAQYIKERCDLGDDVILKRFSLKDNKEFFQTEFCNPNAKDSTLVVASVASSGRELLGVSQVLRNLQRNHGINYIIGLDRLPTPKDQLNLRTNLSYGEKANDYGYYVLQKINLPNSRETIKTSWQEEEDFLKKILTFINEQPTLLDEAKTKITERLKELSKTSKGLIDNLFWNCSADSPLKLRKHTAFLKEKDYKPSDFSQADVFMLVSAILHDLRNKEQNDILKQHDTLRQHEHSKKIISPLNFDRFNDGALQASILRAATSRELDYTEQEHSTQIRELLYYIFQNQNNHTCEESQGTTQQMLHANPGEATREFLLAIAMRKMRLADDDLEYLIESVVDSQDEIAKCFSLYIKEYVLGDPMQIKEIQDPGF